MTTYLSDDSIRGFPDSYVNSPERSAYEYVARVVKEIGGEKATIGVEKGGYYYSARAHADLVKALSQATFVDADLLINWIRLVKSPAELALMRRAGQIGDLMLKRGIEPPSPECANAMWWPPFTTNSSRGLPILEEATTPLLSTSAWASGYSHHIPLGRNH